MLPGNTPSLFGASRGNDAYTKLLLHFDGVNGTNVFIDSSLANHGSTTDLGNAVIASPSGAFSDQKGAYYNPGGGAFTFPHSADWEFGAGDFTIDYWMYRSSIGAIISRDLPTAYCPWLIGYNPNNADLIYMCSQDGVWDIANGRNMGPNIGSVWIHFAVVRKGTTFYTFRDGVQIDTWTSALALRPNTNALCIGAAQNAMNYNGYIDELRISKGIARWTAAFAPPTAPYS